MADSLGTKRGTETGVGIGIALGAGLGVVIDNNPVGIAVGFVLGAAIGRWWEKTKVAIEGFTERSYEPRVAGDVPAGSMLMTTVGIPVRPRQDCRFVTSFEDTTQGTTSRIL